MSSRRAQRRTRPRHPRSPKKRILVYCGATETEPTYLHGLRQRYPNITIEVKAKGKDPAQIVDLAVAYVDRREEDYDSVWCLVDVDAFDLQMARAEALRHGVKLAVSNPCFELWLLLHFCDRRTGAQDCKEITQQLKKNVPTYDKTALCIDDFADLLHEAIARARRLEEDASETGRDPYPNPSSGMWRLAETIHATQAKTS